MHDANPAKTRSLAEDERRLSGAGCTKAVATYCSVRACGPVRRQTVVTLGADGQVESVDHFEVLPMVALLVSEVA